MDAEKPKFLYKYESFSTQSLENLKNRVVYFGSATKFNDPFDCSIRPQPVIPRTDSEIDAYIRGMLARGSNPEGPTQEFSTMSAEQKRIVITRSAINAVDQMVTHFKSIGVSCFSEKNDNVLMWSHYAGHHKGFCLEFSTDSSMFKRARKVTYRNELPRLPLEQFHDPSSGVIDDLFCTKSSDWHYEAEWRVFHEKAGTPFIYEADCLTGVYFGTEMNLASKEIICLIIQNQSENVRFWEGKKSLTEFKVEFSNSIYVPHIEAKRKGLLP